MKHLRIFALMLVAFLIVGVLVIGQEGPKSQSSETVAKPRKKDPAASTPDAPEEPKIPSKFNKKSSDFPEGLPTFKSDATTVQVDVAVLDNKGRFLPKIPRGNFRILEDNVPQQVSSYNTGNEAPMTVALVIEFRNLFQSYWTE